MTRAFGQMIIAAALPVVAATVIGCSHPAPDATPDGALRTWLEKMESSEEDPREMREAYDLLGPRAKKNLAERAERAGRAEGRHVEPWEVLAEGRFGLKFRPQRMTSTIQGNEATVDVVGADPMVEHATVSCDRDPSAPPIPGSTSAAQTPGTGWRVEPDFPPLPAPVARTRSADPREHPTP